MMQGANFRFSNCLEDSQLSFMKGIGQAADDAGLRIYLVGGPLRDLLLGCSIVDLDFMIEGDAIEWVSNLKDSWKEYLPQFEKPDSVAKYKRYGTAKLFFPGELFSGISCVDFASARAEKYPSCAAKPIIEPGDLKSDLSRRDFTCNALAVSLAKDHFGQLFDFSGGLTDLYNGLLRILHERSFWDDPIRLIRVLRFVVRFGFSIEARTKELFEEAVCQGYLKQVPQKRLFDELRKVLLETTALEIVKCLEDNGLLNSISPLMKSSRLSLLPPGQGGLNDGLELWQVRLSYLCWDLREEDFERIISLLSLPREERKKITEYRARLRGLDAD